jgi:bifunctional enzyme CysN/CysC
MSSCGDEVPTIPEPILTPTSRERMHLVIGGHVDHGKSTVIGRLLADIGALPQGKLEQIRERCARTSRPFEYAFLIDALKDEQAQGITIDAARVFFKTAARDYIILDAPGHIEFLRNMVTGAAHAEAALLVIDAREGVQENSRRHGYMMSMLGIGQLAVLVNKMDLVEYRRDVFERIVAEYGAFLTRIGVTPTAFLPVCAREGENLARRGERLAWYDGPTVLEALEGFEAGSPPVHKPFRMPVQDVYKFTGHGDDRRIVAGTIESGAIAAGAEVVFYPSGKHSRVKAIEVFNAAPPVRAIASQATGFTLTDQIYVARGELAALAGEPRPHVTTRLRASLFWLGREPLLKRKDYLLKLGTARVAMRIEEVHRIVDASTLEASETKTQVDRHDVADCTLQLHRAIAFDGPDGAATTSRFVIVDDYEIRGGGIVREALPDRQAWVRDKALLRNYKWDASFIPGERREERYGQKPILLLLTGPRATDRKALAKALEVRLFEDGRLVYFLGMGNVLYGVDADLDRRENRAEHMRRLAEVANIMLDAGVILLVSAAELTAEDLDLICASVEPERIATVWMGDRHATDLRADLVLDAGGDLAESVEHLRTLLQKAGVIVRSW